MGATGIVGAEEHHGGLTVVVQALHLGQCLQPLPAETLGDQGEELGHGRMVSELVVRGAQKPFDRLRSVGTAELLGEPGGGGAQGELVSMLRLAQEGAVMMPFRFGHRRP